MLKTKPIKRVAAATKKRFVMIPLTNKRFTISGSTWRLTGMASGKMCQDTAHKQEVHQHRLHLKADRAGLR